MGVLIRRSKRYPKAVKDAYALLVEYRRRLEDEGNEEKAQIVEMAYKELWCETLNESHPWK